MKPDYICTMGPSINSNEMLIKLYEKGMRIIRFNMSHIDYDLEDIVKRINILKNKGYKIETLVDTKGPEIRIKLKENRIVKRNDILVLYEDLEISANISNLKENDILLIDDAQIALSFLGNKKFKVL